MQDLLEHKPILRAIGWAVLWSAALCRLIEAWPDFSLSLLRPVMLAGAFTFIILIYRRIKEYKSNDWSDPLAWKAALITLFLIALPLLIRKLPWRAAG